MAWYVSARRHGYWIALIAVLLFPRPSGAEPVGDEAVLEERATVRMCEVRVRVTPHPLAHPNACLPVSR